MRYRFVQRNLLLSDYRNFCNMRENNISFVVMNNSLRFKYNRKPWISKLCRKSILAHFLATPWMILISKRNAHLFTVKNWRRFLLITSKHWLSHFSIVHYKLHDVFGFYFSRGITNCPIIEEWYQTSQVVDGSNFIGMNCFMAMNLHLINQW